MADDELIKLSFVADTTQVVKSAKDVSQLKATVDTYSVATTTGVRSAKQLADATGEFAVIASKTTSAAKLYASSIENVGAASTTTSQAQAMFAETLNRVAVASNKASYSQQTQYAGASAGLGNFLNKSQAAAGGANALTYRLSVMGATLDDMQYVGEQGLRPILNNLMMIHPALGIIAIAGETVRKNWTEVSSVAKGTFNYWTEGFNDSDRARNSFELGMGRLATSFASAGNSAVKFFGEVGEGFDAMSGGIQTREKASIGGLEGRKSDADKERGAAVKKGLGQFDGKDVLKALIDQEAKSSPDLVGETKKVQVPNGPSAGRAAGKQILGSMGPLGVWAQSKIDANGSGTHEADGVNQDRQAAKARLAELVKKAEAGDSDSIEALQRRLKGTQFGSAISGSLDGDTSHGKESLKGRKEENDDKIDDANRHNQRIADRQKALGDEVAGSIGSRTEQRILSVTNKGGDQNEFARREQIEIAKKLKATGQVGNDEDAYAVAKLAYDQIFTGTFKKLRNEINKNGGTLEQAAAAVAKDEARKDPRLHAAQQAIKKQKEADEQHAIGKTEAKINRLVGGSGVQDHVTEMLAQSRQQGPRFRTTGQARRYGRMTAEERMVVQGKQNDQDDEQAKKQAARWFVRSGQTRNPEVARVMAETVVGRSRERLNDETGDVATKNLDKSMGELSEHIKKLTTDGVFVKLNR